MVEDIKITQAKEAIQDAYDSLFKAENLVQRSGYSKYWIVDAREHIGYALEELNKDVK